MDIKKECIYSFKMKLINDSKYKESVADSFNNIDRAICILSDCIVDNDLIKNNELGYLKEAARQTYNYFVDCEFTEFEVIEGCNFVYYKYGFVVAIMDYLNYIISFINDEEYRVINRERNKKYMA